MNESKNNKNHLLFFVKILSFFSTPILIIATLLFYFIFALSIFLLYEKIILIGLIILSASLAIFFTQLLLLSIKILLSKQYKQKLFLFILLGSFIGLIVGSIILFLEIRSIKIIENDEKNKIIKTEILSMNDQMIISDLGGKIEFITDESFNDQIKIVIIYDNNPISVSLSVKENDISFSHINKFNFQKFYQKMIDDFRNKKIYIYNFSYLINVYGSEKNIQNILKNTSKKFITEIIRNNNGKIIVSYLQNVTDEMICELGVDSMYHCFKNKIINGDNCSCFYNDQLDLIDCSISPKCSCDNNSCLKTIE